MNERKASVSAGGSTVFLTPSDLRELGIEPTETNQLCYTLSDGRIELSEPAGIVREG